MITKECIFVISQIISMINSGQWPQNIDQDIALNVMTEILLAKASELMCE